MEDMTATVAWRVGTLGDGCGGEQIMVRDRGSGLKATQSIFVFGILLWWGPSRVPYYHWSLRYSLPNQQQACLYDVTLCGAARSAGIEPFLSSLVGLQGF